MIKTLLLSLTLALSSGCAAASTEVPNTDMVYVLDVCADLTGVERKQCYRFLRIVVDPARNPDGSLQRLPSIGDCARMDRRINSPLTMDYNLCYKHYTTGQDA